MNVEAAATHNGNTLLLLLILLSNLVKAAKYEEIYPRRRIIGKCVS